MAFKGCWGLRHVAGLLVPCEYNLHFPALLPVPCVEESLSFRARMDSMFFLGDIYFLYVWFVLPGKLAFPINKSGMEGLPSRVQLWSPHSIPTSTPLGRKRQVASQWV